MWNSIKFGFISSLAQWLIRFPFWIYYCVIHRLKVIRHGAKLDKNRNYLFVSNHRSLKDPPLLALVTASPIAFIAKQELFQNPFLGTVIHILGAIPINRSRPEVSSMKLVKKALSRKAWSAGIFIEGTRSTNPRFLGRPNPGAIFIARMAKVPIVPIGITYETETSIRVEIGEPYEVDPKRDMEEQAWECLEKISKLCDYEIPV